MFKNNELLEPARVLGSAVIFYWLGNSVNITINNNDKVFCCRYGVRNSLLMAPMPTASTAQILGNCESFEPYTSNIYTRRVLSGEFQA